MNPNPFFMHFIIIIYNYRDIDMINFIKSCCMYVCNVCMVGTRKGSQYSQSVDYDGKGERH